MRGHCVQSPVRTEHMGHDVVPSSHAACGTEATTLLLSQQQRGGLCGTQPVVAFSTVKQLLQWCKPVVHA